MWSYASLNQKSQSCTVEVQMPLNKRAYAFSYLHLFLHILLSAFMLCFSSSARFFFSLTDSERAVCNISGKYFNNQTLVSICSVLLVVLQSLIWQHAVLIWLLLHTTTKALNTWALSAVPETE